MKPESASPGYDRAIASARLMASGENARAVNSQHLALGLFAETEGLAGSLARKCGLDVADWVSRYPIQLGKQPVDLLNSTVEIAIQKARRLAREFVADRTVTTDLLLVAIVESDPILASEFCECGLNLKRLQEQVIEPLTAPIELAEPIRGDLPYQAVVAMDVPHQHNEFRILDAAGNRALEALRVIEDYARFGCDDTVQTRLVKQFRHDLAAVIATLPRWKLLEARDTPNDVGVDIETAQEYHRDSTEIVLAANFRRLHESLRSLEEFGKIVDPQLGRQFERLRYQSYTLEKQLVPVKQRHQLLAAAKLYWLITAAQSSHDWAGVHEAIAGGVQIIQLRDKSLSDRQLLQHAMALRKITQEKNVLFIINDRPDVAASVQADGVHVGQDDLPIATARKFMSRHMLVGVSTHSIEQLNRAIADGADYVGIGPTFASKTKTFTQLAGLEFVRAAATCTIPAFILGGISLDNIDQVIDAGGRRVAVADAISASSHPLDAARVIRQKLDAIV